MASPVGTPYEGTPVSGPAGCCCGTPTCALDCDTGYQLPETLTVTLRLNESLSADCYRHLEDLAVTVTYVGGLSNRWEYTNPAALAYSQLRHLYLTCGGAGDPLWPRGALGVVAAATPFDDAACHFGEPVAAPGDVVGAVTPAVGECHDPLYLFTYQDAVGAEHRLAFNGGLDVFDVEVTP